MNDPRIKLHLDIKLKIFRLNLPIQSRFGVSVTALGG